MYYKKLSIFILCGICFLLLGIRHVFASTLYLSPANTQVGAGAATTVFVYLNTQGESINAVTASLVYPSDKIDVFSPGKGGSWDFSAESSAGGGGIRISVGSISGVSGSVLVGSFAVRGKTVGTNASISFAGDSAAVRTVGNTNSLTGTSGGTYTIVQATASPTPLAGPLITNVQATNISSKSATITWKTDVKADSTVEYGLDKGNYFITATDSKQVTDHSVVLDSPLLTPGALLHCHVKSQASGGGVSTGDDFTVQLQGYTVVITVTDVTKKPLPNTTVSFFSQEKQGITDSMGRVQFSNVSSGNHLVAIKTNDVYQIRRISVVDGDISTPQPFNLQLAAAAQRSTRSESANPLILGLGIILAIAPLIILFLLKKQAGEAHEHSL